MNLSARLREAADILEDSVGDAVTAPQFLEGDLSLDELDAYCVSLMREAAQAIASAENR